MLYVLLLALVLSGPLPHVVPALAVKPRKALYGLGYYPTGFL